ncbi:MAG TPA: rhamnulokinase family protein [Bryobacteraceae bacterium]|jgi:sugar (pentulose or hexulose) kinase|nr:rhamnulokinase family protein [Bryobacteraceae bacterium]
MARQFLALDLGAESGRAILAQLARGRIELHELHRFTNTPVQLPAGLYWDTLRLFHEVCEGIRIASKAAGELSGIAVDTWGVDFALLGERGELLDNPRHYRDPRTAGVPQQLFKTVPRSEIFRQTGIQFMDINSLCQLQAVRRDSPKLLDAASKLLFMPDLFNYFLTGRRAAERTIASTSQFYDPVRRCFATELLRKLGLPTDLLCELIEPGTELGRLLPHVADVDVPVYATASHDTASAVAAVPAEQASNWCYISSGTWSLMGVELNGPVIDHASLEANFTNEVGVEGKIRFLKNIPGLWMVQESRRAWARDGQEFTYAELMDRAAAAKPSATVIDLDQFTSPGNHPRRIREHCRQTGQQIPEDAGSTVRVVLQSLAARYLRVLESLENLTGRPIEVIHIVGGGSRNRLLNQMTANVTGRRVIAGPAEATAAGNALTQALGAKDIASLSELRDVTRRSFELEEFVPE